MTCYTRHLSGLLAEAGLDDTPVTRRQLDRAVRNVLGDPAGHCPEIWRLVKERRKSAAFRDEVVAALRRSDAPTP